MTGYPRLSLCMATRNRADFLPEMLASVTEQIGDDVEVVIVDGASTDGTSELLAALAQRDARIRVVSLAANGGVDQDYDRAVAEARGEYCWLITDDDRVEPNAVMKVLAACRGGASLIVVDASVCGPDLRTILEPRRLPCNEARRYSPGDASCLSDLGNHLTFIGAVIIRRSVWMSRDREPYYGSLFIHVGVIFQKPLPDDIVVIPEPLIRIRYGMGGWVSRRFEVWMFLWPQLIWSFAHIPESVRAKVIQAEPWRALRNLVIYRAKGAYGMEEYRRFIAPRAGRCYRVMAWAVAVVPGVLLNAMALLFAHLRGRSGGSGAVDLCLSPFHWRKCRSRR